MRHTLHFQNTFKAVGHNLVLLRINKARVKKTRAMFAESPVINNINRLCLPLVCRFKVRTQKLCAPFYYDQGHKPEEDIWINVIEGYCQNPSDNTAQPATQTQHSSWVGHENNFTNPTPKNSTEAFRSLRLLFIDHNLI